MKRLSYDLFQTPMGWVTLLASETGIRRSSLPCDTAEESMRSVGDEIVSAVLDEEHFADLRGRMLGYFGGGATEFGDIELDTEGVSDFYRRAWNACATIPRGETRTYRWLAVEAGSGPSAARAAGAAMAGNRLPIIVPCHRIIGSDGTLKGFGKGQTRISLKRDLLDMEGARVGDAGGSQHAYTQVAMRLS